MIWQEWCLVIASVSFAIQVGFYCGKEHVLSVEKKFLDLVNQRERLRA